MSLVMALQKNNENQQHCNWPDRSRYKLDKGIERKDVTRMIVCGAFCTIALTKTRESVLKAILLVPSSQESRRVLCLES